MRAILRLARDRRLAGLADWAVLCTGLLALALSLAATAARAF